VAYFKPTPHQRALLDQLNAKQPQDVQQPAAAVSVEQLEEGLVWPQQPTN
jgi:hypothetical protein